MARALAPTDLDLRLLPRPQSADLGGLGAYAVELEAPVFPVALPPGDAMAGRGQVGAGAGRGRGHDEGLARSFEMDVERALVAGEAQHAARARHVHSEVARVGPTRVEANGPERAMVPDAIPRPRARDAGRAETLDHGQVLAGEDRGHRLSSRPLVDDTQRGQRSHALPRVEVVVDVDGADPARALRALERLHDVTKAIEGPRPEIRVEVLVGRRGVALPVPPDRAPEGGEFRVRRPLAIEHGIAAVDVRQAEPLHEGEGLLAHPRRPRPLEEPDTLAA